MKKLLLGFAIVVTLTWSPTFRANPPDSEPVLKLVPEHVTGVASWYGEMFHGKATASGEVYDMNRLTAAHQTIPMGTWVEITNVRNVRSVTVRINDRGPAIRGRMIDVSKAAARALGFMGAGTATVQVKVLDSPPAARSIRSKPARSLLISSAAAETSPRKEPFVRQ